MQIGHRVRKLREERHRSVQDLAAAAEISVDDLMRLEVGNRHASHQEVVALSHALGVGIDELLAEPESEEEMGGPSLLIPAAQLSKLLDQMKE